MANIRIDKDDIKVEIKDEIKDKKDSKVSSLFKKAKSKKNFRKRNLEDLNQESTFYLNEINSISKRHVNPKISIKSNNLKNHNNKESNFALEQAYKTNESSSLVKSGTNSATKEAEFDTEFCKDQFSNLERRAKSSQNPSNATGENIEYKGQTSYTNYLKIGDKVTGNIVNSKMKQGPIRAPKNLRVTCRFDYQPDVCKDYKETGYCGFGDGCVFMHDRSDYKSGWELEKEWEQKKRNDAKNRGLNKLSTENNESEQDSDDELPFACFICRNEFKKPVVTKCQHYFCEACALKEFVKSPKCYACGSATDGSFTVAKDLIAKIEKKNKINVQ